MMLIFAGEELKQVKSLAQQLSAENSSALVWGVGDMHQPLSEAVVSSYRHQQKLAGLLLQGDPPEPLPEVSICRGFPSEVVCQRMSYNNLRQPCSQLFS